MSKRTVGAVIAVVVVGVLAWVLWPRGGGGAREQGAAHARDGGAAVARRPAVQGGIDGVVRDERGAPVAGATVPWIGFHTYGEIAELGGQPYYHNYTVVLCALYERG